MRGLGGEEALRALVTVELEEVLWLVCLPAAVGVQLSPALKGSCELPSLYQCGAGGELEEQPGLRHIPGSQPCQVSGSEACAVEVGGCVTLWFVKGCVSSAIGVCFPLLGRCSQPSKLSFLFLTPPIASHVRISSWILRYW